MKILMLLSNPLMVYMHVYKEAKGLTDAGNEVTVVAWDRKKEYEPESIVDGIRVVRLLDKGCNASVCDSFLGKNYYTLLPEDIADKIQGFNSIEEVLSNDIDTLVFITRHDEYLKLDLEKIIRNKISRESNRSLEYVSK